jgi:hypothetical protein
MILVVLYMFIFNYSITNFEYCEILIENLIYNDSCCTLEGKPSGSCKHGVDFDCILKGFYDCRGSCCEW